MKIAFFVHISKYR